MDVLQTILDFFLHLDRHLSGIITQYGTWTYGILFAVIFCETGLVVTPFLPGDSLLFAAGAFAALGSLKIVPLYFLLLAAAIAGDNMNYWIGRGLGPKIFSNGGRRWLNRGHLERTHRFFERYGTKAIILARFVPIVRTFTPFVAGVGRMTYRRFVAFDAAGGILWVSLFTLGGYFFGNIPVIKERFTLVIAAIILLSLTPALVEILRHRRKPTSSDSAPTV